MQAELRPAATRPAAEASSLPTQLPALDPRVVVESTMSETFRSLGLTTPEAFLAIPGEIVSGHPDRHVMRVELGDGATGYLKREHRVRRRDRFRNWQAGYGWVSNSVREGRTLQYFESCGFPGPQWLAFGDDGANRSFLLVAEVSGAKELRRLFPTLDRRANMAARLGRFCAELHEAGFDHPDLFAKHFLIDEATATVTLLDWQRSEKLDRVPWPKRYRALAAFLATLPDRRAASPAQNHFRSQFLWNYLDAVGKRQKSETPSYTQAAGRIWRLMQRLERRRGIREQRQLPLPEKSQRLVWLDGEALCAVPDVAGDLRWPAVQTALYDPVQHGSELMLGGNRPAKLRVARHRLSPARFWAWLRGKSWRSPELRLARLLFHLERHHVAAPKLLAFGQRFRRLDCEAFVLHERAPQDAVRLDLALRDAASARRTMLLNLLAEMLTQLHESGCQAVGPDRFAVHGKTLLVAVPEGLVFRRYLSDRRKKVDLVRCLRSMKTYCEAEELENFIRAASRPRR